MFIDVKIKLLEGAKLPEYKTAGASGMDAFAYEGAVIFPGKHALISLGFHCELPENYELQVRPRSGLAAKKGITVLNTPGTIDEDFRGEVKVILQNNGSEVFTVDIGDRVCQLVLAEVPKANLIPVNELSQTVRNQGGFGSTGV